MNWKKLARWTGSVVALLIIVVLAGSYVALRTPCFHHYVLAKIIDKGEGETGGTLLVQDWDVHFFPVRVDLYGIVLHGTEPEDASPLLQVDKLTVGLKFSSLLHRQLRLSELLIQHPVAHVVVNTRGMSNVPTPPTKQTGNTILWSLAVQHTELNDGDIYYNGQETPLNVDLRDLKSKIGFDAAETRYSGFISYRNGRFQYANYSPLPHNLDAHFSATPSGAALTSLLLTIGASQISLQGEMKDYEHPQVSAGYHIQLHTQDFATWSAQLTPKGDVQLAGKIHYQNTPNEPLLRTVSVTGNLASPDLQAASAEGAVTLRDLNAQYQLANGNLAVHGFSANLMGGRLTGDLIVKQLGERPAGTIRASLHRVSIESARRSSAQTDVRQMPVTGTMDAKLDGSWAGSVKNIRLLGDVILHAAVWNNSSIPKSAIPLDANAHLAYNGPRKIVTLHQSTLHIPSTSVVLDGNVGGHLNLQVHAVDGDLRQLAAVVSSLQSNSSRSASQAIDVSGSAKLDAVVQGSLHSPRLAGQLSAQNLQVQGSRWKTARLFLQATPSQINIQQATLINAGRGSLNFSATIGLQNWSYQPSGPITANLSAQGLSLTELEHLANRQYPVSGTLSANVSFRGSQLHPGGHGSVQVVKANAYDQPIQKFDIQFQTENDSIDSRLNAMLPAGSVTATLAYTPKTKAYQINLQAPGIVVQQLQAVQARDLPLAGTLMASATGSGTIDNPQLNVTLQIPSLQVRQTTVTQMQAQLVLQNRQANLNLTSDIAPAFIHANATVDLTGGYNTQATIDTNKVPLEPFLTVYAPSVPEGFHSETELHASLKGPLKDISKVEAHLTIPTLKGSYQSLQFSNVGPIRADYANSVVTLAPGEIRGTETSLTFQARVPIHSTAAMDVKANGNVNLRLLEVFSSAIKSTGAIKLSVDGGGTLRQPSIQGKIQVQDAALSTSSVPLGLSNVNGTLNLQQDRIEIGNLTGELGGGKISAGGAIIYRPQLQFNVALRGKSVRLLYPDGVRSLLDANLTFTGNLQAATLSGRTLVDSLNFTPDFDLTSFAGQFNGISIPPTGESFPDRIKLAVLVQSNQSLAAHSQQISLEGVANLQVTGRVSDPVIVGRVDLTSAELFFLKNRYTLKRGVIIFNDPNRTQPVLNVQVTTTIEQYNLTLTLIGPLNRLTTSYVSDPALPQADIINLVYSGQTLEEAEGAGTSTDSMLAGQAVGQVTGAIQQLGGISSLQIDPLIGGNNVNPSARIALQQRVTKDLLFTYSTDVSQPNQQIVQGEYQINKRWSVSVERDELGGFSVDARVHTHF
jgi:translocation and assembly module TamB